ncbi:MAG: cupredoxin domain-containing protein [Chloroflexota bacterium]
MPSRLLRRGLNERIIAPMRHALQVALALVTLALAAACSSTQPGWTYAPASPSGAPAASGGASSAPGSGAPSGAPASGATGSPAASGAASGAPASGPAASGGGAVIALSAQGTQFEQPTIQAPADRPFKIEFSNKDAGQPHNVQIKDNSGALKFDGEIITGVANKTYDVPALPAGAYKFDCVVHANMVGTLTVQ